MLLERAVGQTNVCVVEAHVPAVKPDVKGLLGQFQQVVEVSFLWDGCEVLGAPQLPENEASIGQERIDFRLFFVEAFLDTVYIGLEMVLFLDAKIKHGTDAKNGQNGSNGVISSLFQGQLFVQPKAVDLPYFSIKKPMGNMRQVAFCC
jgi:hypothetical protein